MKAPNLGSIQALRGYAAVAVMVGHVLYEADATFGIARTHVFPYTAGVHIFFVISGFIMAYTNAAAFGQPGAVKRFVTRRIQRIVPLYWIFTSMVLAVLLAGVALRSTTLNWANVIASYLFWPDAPPSGPGGPLLSVGWTLNFEMLFYAIFAVCLLLPRRRALLALTVLMTGMVALHWVIPHSWVALSFWTDPIILEFVAGVWIGHAYVLVGKRFASPSRAVIGFAAGFALLLASRVFDLYVADLNWAVIYGPASAVLVASAALLLPPVAEVRIPAFLLLLGDSSYALYLSHRFPLRIVSQASEMAGIHNYALTVVLGIVACTATGILAFWWIEKPILRMFRTRPPKVTSYSRAAIEVAP